MTVHQTTAEPWVVTLVDTGPLTHTSGRIKRVLPYVGDDEAVCVTYGDGVADLDVVWGQEPLERLAREGQLVSYRHESFWYAMDTVRDQHHLEELWAVGEAPWKVWE